MDENPYKAPRIRRWFRFSLASLLACVTACAVVIGLARPWETDWNFEVIGDIAATDLKQLELLVQASDPGPILRMRRFGAYTVKVETGPFVSPTSESGATFTFSNASGKWESLSSEFWTSSPSNAR